MSEQDTDARSDERTAPEVPEYDLRRQVGSGGFGDVWLATNRTTGRLCAVKVIPLHSSGSADPAAREISSITRLEANSRCRHPNLLQIHHVGKTARHLFYVMDPADDVSGNPAADTPDYRPATLQGKLDGAGKGDRSNLRGPPFGCCAQIGPIPFSRGPLPAELCCDYAQQLLAGLAMLHGAGMVHRDVKPSNCLFVGGQLKLADFGLLTEAHPLVSRVGTQKYMPPDGHMDRRADVYAAGLVIYEMLSGLPVDEFPRLGARSQEVCGNATLAALLRLVLRACEREAKDRPADARAMLAELTAPAQSAQRHPYRRFAAVCAVALAAAGVGAWMLYDRWPGDAGLLIEKEEKAGAVVAKEGPVPNSPTTVDVSFVTYPFEAAIYVDGELLRPGPKEKPYQTPCTVRGLAARKCRVAFELNGRRWEDGASPYDLAKTQQIVSRMP
jgi:eukaryotic-like serine/threonine-protein kinase